MEKGILHETACSHICRVGKFLSIIFSKNILSIKKKYFLIFLNMIELQVQTAHFNL